MLKTIRIKIEIVQFQPIVQVKPIEIILNILFTIELLLHLDTFKLFNNFFFLAVVRCPGLFCMRLGTTH